MNQSSRAGSDGPGAPPAGRGQGASPRPLRLLCALLIAAAVTALHAAGALQLVDNAFHDLRMRAVDRPASGELVLVEIDAASLRRLGQWPWPRGHHAQVLDRLIAAGAARVAFDVSFSSPSDPAQDARLAEAAARAGDRLVLPVFQQPQRDADGTQRLLEDRPLLQLFPETPLASINVRPDADGIVRRLSTADRIGDAEVPFLATALLPAGTQAAGPPYLIDFGLDVASVPRLSYADVLIGQFDATLVAGRSVLVGATAIELGDVLAVPRWVNLPGPLVIASGFETWIQDRAARPLDAPWFVFALCIAAALAPAGAARARPLEVLLPALFQTAALAGLSMILYLAWALKLDLAPVGLALLMAHAVRAGRLLHLQSRRIAAQNREAERRQALLRSVVATSIDAVVITDSDGAIRLANPACRTVFGETPEALVGRAADSLIGDGDRLLPQLRAMGRGGPVPALSYPVDVEGRHADGSPLQLELSIAVTGAEEADDLLDNRHHIYVFRDVSAQRQLEASRRLALEARIEAERAKADFLATASHELRTPLNHIKGFASLLAAGVGGALSAKQSGYVGDIEAAADHLFEIVTDILSHAEQGESDAPAATVAISVGDLLSAAGARVAAIAREKEVVVETTGNALEASLAVNQDEMVRAVMHVLRNAVQFSPPGGVVRLSAESAPGAAGIRIAVADAGPGMTDEQIARVLPAFGQVEGAMARRHGGLGIGLSLARRCVERHGGHLAIVSAPGRGTTVTLELPTAVAAPARSAA